MCGIAALALLLLGSVDESPEDEVPGTLQQDLAQADPDADPYLRLEGLQDRLRPQEPRQDPSEPPTPIPPSPPSVFGDSPYSVKAWKENVWDGYLTQPEVLIPVGLGLSAAIVSHWDRRLASRWNGLLGRHRSYSDIGQYALIGSVVLLGGLFPGDGRDSWNELWTIGEAYAATGVSVFVLKSTFRRPRPGGKGWNSFPSGHSASAFTAATLIEENSGPWAGIPAYGLAAFTAFERVEEGRHYPSDIIAGAALGILTAELSDHLHWGRRVQLGVGFADGLKSAQVELAIRF